MGHKKGKTAAPIAPGNRNSRTSARRRRSRGLNPLVWLATALGVIVLLVAANLIQSRASAKLSAPSRTENIGDLLPLAQSVRPLRGGHEMNRIPAQTPAPQPAPEGVDVPQLQMPSASHDFGSIPRNPVVTHIFAVQNTGTADLRLGNLVTSCGCTTARTSSSVIPPGQRADLTVTFDPNFHEIEGEAVRLVWFATNDPTQPWIEVRITADVQP
jgi:hypothetical protein